MQIKTHFMERDRQADVASFEREGEEIYRRAEGQQVF